MIVCRICTIHLYNYRVTDIALQKTNGKSMFNIDKSNKNIDKMNNNYL